MERKEDRNVGRRVERFQTGMRRKWADCIKEDMKVVAVSPVDARKFWGDYSAAVTPLEWEESQ